jgi:hypothetical protein
MQYFTSWYTFWECFFGFCCFILLILTLQIYCLEAPIIGLQHLYLRFPKFSYLSLWNISWLSNDVLLAFQWSELLQNAYLVSSHYDLFFNGVLFWFKVVVWSNLIVLYDDNWL